MSVYGSLHYFSSLPQRLRHLQGQTSVDYVFISDICICAILHRTTLCILLSEKAESGGYSHRFWLFAQSNYGWYMGNLRFLSFVRARWM